MTSIASATSATTPTVANPSTATTSTATMGKDQFLQLLVAQMKNQDPTDPVQGTDFVTQLAQFSIVEQSQAQSTTLSTMSTQLSGLSNEQSTSLVGQTVTVSGGSTTYDGSSATPASVTLGSAATDATATISDSSGNVLRTIDLGAQPAGVTTVNWDGRSDTGMVQPSGTYSVNVSATGENGAAVNVSSTVSGVVASVGFAGGTASVTLANGTVASVAQLTSVAATASK